MNRSFASFVKPRIRELYLKPCLTWLIAFGFNPLAFFASARGVGSAVRDYCRLRAQSRLCCKPLKIRFSMPCLGDRFEAGGSATGHYFNQDLLVARRIFERCPQRHVDVGSRVDGFVAHVASFRDVEVFDIRPTSVEIPHIVFRQADLMSVGGELESCCDSLSCLHALEHFGLGRYGDPVDVQGYVRGFANLTRILRPGGVLYLSVPIGPERLDFNANWVFEVQTILDLARADFDLSDFSYVDDDGFLHRSAPVTPENISRQFDCVYGCGIFEFRKKSGVA